ncbi:MAG: cytochrome-c oxidase, cbb3-type subunit II [Ponticaulis sp.]|nr:cytochrome-c oxidase, cbb3-type subunit II [Ponticaulis sp.]
MSIMNRHGVLERHSLLLTVAILVAVSIGGIIQMVPLMYMDNTIEKVDGMRPYTPLELAGKDIYIREGCYVCHSQMVRPLRDEVERYGHYSLAAESMYDHPFQWGSKRSGPDLARVGGKYSDEWHLDHLKDPRALVPESIMPPYEFLAKKELDFDDIQGRLKTERLVGVPYTDEMIENAEGHLIAQADPEERGYDYVDSLFDAYEGIAGREGTVKARDYDGDPTRITEMDALIAYLQMTGTLVDFSTFEADDLSNAR